MLLQTFKKVVEKVYKIKIIGIRLNIYISFHLKKKTNKDNFCFVEEKDSSQENLWFN